ncbi:sugar ABC transporter substrate-binding protein [Luteimonas terricola]|uniref:Sugar ABC transporter substrate-binding protein n=1 Tax=Luteimonas terricola TaxID=645597 RepID=A0ABQ2EDP4_9GAMM|nr:sugar ABC transporter substrate-binding protein [Luteimonas terricola]GGK04682.1 sugar ABC transporter substrate-binding protein [Luteimonas terricola]
MSQSRPRGVHAALLLALVVLGALVAGCARKVDDGTTTIRFWAMGREAEIVATLLPDFQREHPQLRVELQAIPWTAAHEKLLTAYAADAMPDLLQLGNTWIPEFAALDALEPLGARIDASATIDAGDYFPGIRDTNVVDDEVLGVPWYVDTRLLFYRKDILRDAGVAVPLRTWDEWASAMEAIQRHVGPGRYAILLPLNEFEPQLSLALQQPDPLLRDNGTRGNFQSDGFRETLAFYARMFEEGWAPVLSETQISNVWDEFFRGFNAFYLSGPWNIREFRRRAPPGLADQWGTMPLPGPDGPGAGIAGGTSLVLPRGGAHADAAWLLVEYLSRPEVQRRFHALSGNLPPRRSTWEHPELADDPLAAAFRDQLERVRPTPKVLEWERIAQEIRLVTERVVRGGLPQDQAVRQLDASVDAILAKRRWIVEQEGR